MEITVSRNGSAFIPKRVLEKFGIHPGAKLDLGTNAGNFVLCPRRKRRRYLARIVDDPVTGIPSLHAGPTAPILTHQMVKDILDGTIHNIVDPAT